MRLRSAVALLAVAAAVATGCGGSTGSTANGGTGAPTSAAPAISAPPDDVHFVTALAQTSPGDIASTWAAADIDGSVTRLLRDAPLLAAQLDLGTDPERAPAPGISAGFASTRPRELGVDEPDVETSTKTDDVEAPSGQTLRSTVTNEMRLEQRRLTMTSTQSIAAVGQPGAGQLGQNLGGQIGVCPTIDGRISGDVHYRVELGAGDSTSIVNVDLTAELHAIVDEGRNPVSFDLLEISGGLESTDEDGDPIAVTADGQVTAAPGDLHAFAGGTMHVSIDGDGDLLTDETSLMFGAAVAQLQIAARTMLAVISGATDNGLCVKVVVDRHGVQILGPSETTSLDVSVIDAVTGRTIDGPADAVPVTGTVEPRVATSTPATFHYTARAERDLNTLYVGTDSVLGAHSIKLTYDQRPGWKVDTKVSVFRMVGTKCDGVTGAWRFALSADFEGAVFSGEVVAVIGANGAGPFTLTGQTSGSGVTVAQGGQGTMTITEHDDGSATMTITGQAHTIFQTHVGEGGPFGDGTPISLTQASSTDCTAARAEPTDGGWT